MKYVELANRRNEILKKVGARLFKFAEKNCNQRDILANRSKFKKVSTQKELVANYKLARQLHHDMKEIKSIRFQSRILENRTLEQRLIAFKTTRRVEKENTIRAHIESCLRIDNEIFLNFDCADNSVDTEDFLNWDYYAKSCRYPKKQVNAIFNFKMSLDNVCDNIDLIFADDVLIMPDLINYDHCVGKQVKNGRGYTLQLSSKEMFVVVKNGYSGHSSTLQRAVNIVNKKLAIDAEIENGKRQFVCNLFKNRNVKLTRDDSKGAGNCRAGTESFIAKMALRGTYITIRKAWLLYKRTKNNNLKRVIEYKLNLTLSK